MIEKLKRDIEQQTNENIRLYNSIPLASKKDPENKNAEHVLDEWRKGSKKVKEFIKELNEITKAKVNEVSVNGYGERTDRYITSQTYENQQNRLSKEVMSFIS